MAETLFKIAPLVFKKDCGSWRAGTPFGSYSLRKKDSEDGGGWRWSFCFDEYFDEDNFDCKTKAAGIAAAQAHWIERISRALVAVAKARASKGAA